jgi:hypothetical protein
MAEIYAGLFILLCFAVLFLHVLTLPANWIIFGLLALWKAYHPAVFEWNYLFFLGGILVIGEIVDFAAGVFGAKKYGSSTQGNWGGIIGSILGAITGAPFFLGFGALLGGLSGAFLGCMFVELMNKRGFEQAKRSAWGAMFGRFIGMSVKAALGVLCLFMTVPKIWPG